MPYKLRQRGLDSSDERLLTGLRRLCRGLRQRQLLRPLAAVLQRLSNVDVVGQRRLELLLLVQQPLVRPNRVCRALVSRQPGIAR